MNNTPSSAPLAASSTDSTLLRPASQRGAIDPFIVMDVMSAAAEQEAAGADVVHMEVGQPATPAPRAAREAVEAAMRAGPLGYTLALGMPQLRERIARHYKDRYGVSVPAERIVITTGSSAAFLLAFLSLFDVGDRLALPVPGYPCYRHIATALGLDIVPVVTSAADRWMPTSATVSRLAADTGARGLLLASPANPTGTMLEPDRLAAIVKACRESGIWFISDEIYHGLAYAQPEATALAYSDQVIVINSFSKYFSMTGWRVGWMVVPEGLVRQVERLSQNLFICPPAVAQVAALGSFDGLDELEDNRRVYVANRDLLLRELPKAGLDQIVPADGAFYLYVDVGAFTNDALAFSKAMLAEIGVAATPGVDFDPERGSRYLRFSYAGSTMRR
jgi:aspartate/methionine/tyrosine aminotransferase